MVRKKLDIDLHAERRRKKDEGESGEWRGEGGAY